MFNIRKIFIALSLLFAGSSAIVLSNPIKLEKVDATQTTNYLTGYSGEVLYVNGQSKWFNDGEANLAVYFYKSDNTSINAWANPEYVYRLFADTFIVPVPYFNGEKVKYSHLIICRYDVSKNPLVNGFDGRLNQTNDISIANATIYGKNTISITGISDGILQYGTYVTNQNGIKSESHIYLDLSGFTDWETGGAKFAVYFGYPNFRAEETAWSKAYSDNHSAFTSAFCWKVKGQNNEHLYECIVPNINGKGGNNHVWSMVIAVRLNPDCSEPNWYCRWNQTQNLGINSTNTNANIIKITDWDKGELLENYITDDDRADFFGNHFLNTVVCSGGEYDATSEAMWDDVRAEYMMHLSTDVEGKVWLAKADAESERIVEQAIARYDYIILYKNYEHDDFIYRQTSPSVDVLDSANSVNYANNNIVMITVLIVSLSTISASILLLAFKKYMKKKER